MAKWLVFISVTVSYINVLLTLLLSTVITVWKQTSNKLDSMIHELLKKNETKKSYSMKHKRCKTK